MQPILEMRGITKTFPGRATRSTTSTSRCARGEIHARGRRERRRQVDADEGAVRRLSARHLRRRDPASRARTARFRDIADSEKLGIIIIHQELALVPLLSIAENIFLGNEVGAAAASSTGTRPTRRTARAAGEGRAQANRPTTLVTDIGVGKQQLVEIAKALSKEVKLLILDEPTASLQRDRQRRAARPAAGVQGAGHLLDPDLAQAQRDRRRSPTASPCCATAPRSTTLDCHAPRRSARTASSATWSAARWPTAIRTRAPKIGEMLFEVEDWNVYHQVHADRQHDQGRRACNVRARRDRRHRRPDGRRAAPSSP